MDGAKDRQSDGLFAISIALDVARLRYALNAFTQNEYDHSTQQYDAVLPKFVIATMYLLTIVIRYETVR